MASVVKAFATKSGLQRELVDVAFSGKLYRLSVCFNRGVWFDTLKNRVVTSIVILALRRVQQYSNHRGPLDTAQFKE